LMQQYAQLKGQYPDAILLYRVGDFYETFGEDAVKTADVLGIVLTSRNNGGNDVELAGFPFHALDMYLPRLVKAGYRVAICEQLELPSKQKKIVKRGVTEMITPGLALSDNLLDFKENNYLACYFSAGRSDAGIAFLDISTGEFYLAEGTIASISKLLQSFQPAEVVLPKGSVQSFKQHFGESFYTYGLDEWIFTTEFTRQKLLDHFQVATLKGFGVEDLEAGQIAAGATLHYLSSTENNQLAHITSLRRLQEGDYVWLDKFTIRNLELLRSQGEGGKALVDIMDETVSPMGARLLRRWLIFPLLSVNAIQRRLAQVSYFYEHPALRDELSQLILQIGDLERLISKVSVGKVNPREVNQLKKALKTLVPIQKSLSDTKDPVLITLADNLQLCQNIRDRIEELIQEDPPAQIQKGQVIRSGVHEELDDLRHTIGHSKEILLDIQSKESAATGITNLKIGFNNVFGYYLEVTNRYKDAGLIPGHWVRKQTLANAERYVSDELKKLETKILGAEERIQVLEEELFRVLLTELLEYVEPIQHNARTVAKLDCLLAFAKLAEKNRYVKPVIDDDFIIDIKDGRHPVIEQQLPLGEQYVPNDIYLDNDQQQVLMITGPNMSGKSAVLRQTALICLMAQMGSFVPAGYARIGLLDRIYTRVGASDNISSGESTFMVEMNETANILNNITSRSLILLDEIGRGTSTYDGISIAWSIAEYLHENEYARAKTLFATHYHELNELTDRYHRVKNFNVAVKDIGSKIIFLRKLVPGGSSHSFGIHVAKMAGMPREVVRRAEQLLVQLEQRTTGTNSQDRPNSPSLPQPMQLNIFESSNPELEALRQMVEETDLHRMTPIECMLKIKEWQEMLAKVTAEGSLG
ncbi:MAG: DNA mismatch repair protein MutS, partial [Saprospiraceae bacterium]|nr:DNA mismatch repair protein MutS [Saprospiraceae bacterium]